MKYLATWINFIKPKKKNWDLSFIPSFGFGKDPDFYIIFDWLFWAVTWYFRMEWAELEGDN